MSEKGEKEKKVSRREFLKYSGKSIARGGTAYGIAGNIAGEIYEIGKGTIGKYVLAPAKDVYDNRGKYWDEFKRKIKGEEEIVIPGKTPQTSKNDTSKKEPEKQSRREFLRTILGFGHRHPVFTGTAFGAIYGARKSAARNYENYKTQLARKQTELTNATTQEKIEKLTEEIQSLKKIILEQKSNNSLENKVGGGTLLVVGFSILIVSIILNSWNFTGYAILGYKNGIFSVDVFLFIISIIFIFVGFKRSNS